MTKQPQIKYAVNKIGARELATEKFKTKLQALKALERFEDKGNYQVIEVREQVAER